MWSKCRARGFPQQAFHHLLLCCCGQTLQKEIQGHEPRIADLMERQRTLGTAAAGPELAELQEMWKRLGHELELRGKRLEEALRAQQFYRDAAEAEAWMGEQELHMMGQEKAKVRAGAELRCVSPPPTLTPCCPCPLPQDELSAQAEVKKHQVLEQALADYAQTIHQLAASSQDMIDHEHPERQVHRQQGGQPWGAVGGEEWGVGGEGGGSQIEEGLETAEPSDLCVYRTI